MVFLIGLIACAAFIGCGEDGGEATSTPDGPLVTYERAGGVGFTAVRLAIERDGRASLETRTTAEPAVGGVIEVPSEELAELEGLVDEAASADIETSTTEGCADCYSYEIGLGDETLRFDSASFPDELEPLVAQLDEIASANGAPEALGGA